MHYSVEVNHWVSKTFSLLLDLVENILIDFKDMLEVRDPVDNDEIKFSKVFLLGDLDIKKIKKQICEFRIWLLDTELSKV